MSDQNAVLLTGQCHCGSVKYEAQGPITREGVCTCRACQRATGALESPNVGVNSAGFTITSGIPSKFVSESNEDCDSGTFYFCNRCGTQLYWTDAGETEIAIFAGSLDNTYLFTGESE